MHFNRMFRDQKKNKNSMHPRTDAKEIPGFQSANRNEIRNWSPGRKKKKKNFLMTE